jgi:vacuolar-type H+-ATPase subunit I/STV1
LPAPSDRGSPGASDTLNNARRKQISELIDRIDELQSELETVRDEEQEYFDNMPENLQQGDKGQNAEQAASDLSSAHDSLVESLEYLRNMTL